MAEPARSAAGPGPDDGPERKPDPRASGWGDVRAIVVTEARAVRLAAEDVRRAVEGIGHAVGELRHSPHDPGKLDAVLKELGAALEMNGLNVDVMESAVVIAGRCEVDEAVIEAERARAVAEDRAARRRLEVIGGGAAGRA